MKCELSLGEQRGGVVLVDMASTGAGGLFLVMQWCEYSISIIQRGAVGSGDVVTVGTVATP